MRLKPQALGLERATPARAGSAGAQSSEAVAAATDGVTLSR